MAASHTVVGGLGVVAAIAIFLTVRTFGETLDADAGDAPYSGLWVYTPYVGPGERIAAKVFLKGGGGVRVHRASAAIDGAAVAIEDRHDKAHRPSRRFDMGELAIELRAVAPAGLAPGEHQLAFDLETTCEGSSYSKACGSVHLAAPFRVGDAFAFKLLAAVRAIGAALVVFFGLRRGWDPLKRWASAGDKKGGGAVAMAFLVLILVWAWCGYSLFARPLGAALASASDVLYGVAITAWLAVWPVAVRTRHRGLRSEPRTQAIVRFVPVEDFEPVVDAADAGGYRAAPARKPPARPNVSLDAIAAALYRKNGVRYRRSGNRLLPRWIHGPPVVFEAAAGEDAGLGFRMVGDFGYIIIFATVIAARFGRLQITIDDKSVVVDQADMPVMVKAKLDGADPASVVSASPTS